jgi:NAD(P)-dependent dehydrogenase (short-subunit alcohol dehydrogenase family)
MIASRKLDACQSVAAEVNERFGRDALAVGANVSSWNDCDALVAAAYDRFGRVDVLVNKAGMSPVYPSVDQVSEALYDKVPSTNLKGPFRLTALVGTKMAAGEGGSVINISSVEAASPGPNPVPYGAAKAGLEALTVGFMRFFGPKVRVNTIRCGAFRTDRHPFSLNWSRGGTLRRCVRRRWDRPVRAGRSAALKARLVPQKPGMPVDGSF